MIEINSKYLRGYIEDRLELLKTAHQQTQNDSSYRIQMMARIDELEEILREIKVLEELVK